MQICFQKSVLEVMDRSCFNPEGGRSRSVVVILPDAVLLDQVRE